MLRQACLDAAGWPEDVDVAVNLSPVQFKNPNLVSSVRAALEASGLSAHRLELEITESVLLQNSEATLAVLHELRGFGVRISLDDFGTGYSSLSYLRSFPFDKIKIDRSFVSELATRDDSMAIVRAVTGLGKSLGDRHHGGGRRDRGAVRTVAPRRLHAGAGLFVQPAAFQQPKSEGCCPKHRSRALSLSALSVRVIGSKTLTQALRSAKCAPQNAIAAPRPSAARPASTPETRRDRAGRGGGLSGAGQDQHADRDQELPHPLRDLPGYRAVHQIGGEIAAGKPDGRNQPPRDGGTRRHEFVGVGSPQAAEIEAVARAQHVHGKRQQHPGDHRAGQNQAARKIGRLGHGLLVR